MQRSCQLKFHVRDNKVLTYLLIFPFQVEPETIKLQAAKAIPNVHDIHQNFDRFFFTSRSIAYDESAMAVLSMFDDMGFIQRYRIKREPLTKYVVTLIDSVVSCQSEVHLFMELFL